MPKPLFENKQQEQFYKDNLTKMFGVRIPTEDKRSMLVLKVVDYVDSSKLNNIIVPQFVHMLSGSDFDIDSLFGRMKSYYKTAKKNYVLFGDYSQFKNEDAGKFIEFMHFMSKHDDFSVAIKAEKKKLIGENTFALSDESPVFEVLNALGFNLGSDVQEFFDRKETKSKLAEEKEFSSYMFELAKDAKELYVQTKLDAETNPVDKELAKSRNQYGYEYAIIKSVKQKSLAEKRALRERMNIIDAAYEYQAILNVFSEFGLPASIEKFKSDARYNDMVTMKYQNDNLDASIRLLANEAVFNYL
jgi:DNA-directed RNA polymerase beta subunit